MRESTSEGAEDEIRGAGEDDGRERHARAGDEPVEELVRAHGPEPPPERGHDQQLHAADGAGLEHERRLHHLQVEQRRHRRLLHLRRQRQTCHGQQLVRPLRASLHPTPPTKQCQRFRTSRGRCRMSSPEKRKSYREGVAGEEAVEVVNGEAGRRRPESVVGMHLVADLKIRGYTQGKVLTYKTDSGMC